MGFLLIRELLTPFVFNYLSFPQEKLISSQEELLSRGANLSKSLESSSAGVQRLFEEFRASTENQRLMIRDTIAQVMMPATDLIMVLAKNAKI